MPRISGIAAPDGNVRAAALVLEILDALGRSDEPLRMTDLATRLGATKTRIYRHLRTLVNLDYVTQEPDTERYLIGARLVQLGSALANRFSLLDVSRPVMRRLRDALGHTVVLSRFMSGKVFAIERVDGSSVIVFGTTIGAPLGLHSSAQGKIALAFGPPDLLEATIRAGLKALTARTIAGADRLRREIDEVRRRRWAVAPGETLTGLNGLAVPLLDRSGALIATLAILGSVDEIKPQPSRRQIAALMAASREISLAIGEAR
jgi:DNA-binding IclR family transcriptional regulator